jgi:hypothetical protein
MKSFVPAFLTTAISLITSEIDVRESKLKILQNNIFGSNTENTRN